MLLTLRLPPSPGDCHFIAKITKQLCPQSAYMVKIILKDDFPLFLTGEVGLCQKPMTNLHPGLTSRAQ